MNVYIALALARRDRLNWQLELERVRYVLTVQEQQKKRRAATRRTCWVRPWLRRRIFLGQYIRLMEMRTEDIHSFTNYMRMPPELVDEVLQRIGHRIQKQTTFWREPLSPGLRFAITMRYLASGDSYRSLQNEFRVANNTIAGIIPEVCEAIIAEFMDECIVCPSTPDEWLEVERQFRLRWNMPHALGAIDGKHVAIKCPPHTGTRYYNYKGYFSIIMLALVDADYKYIWLNVGANGGCSDAQIFNSSDLKPLLEDASIAFPPPRALPEERYVLPYYFVGDDAFALRTWMMKPYSRRNMAHRQRIYNYRVSRARRIVENVFGITAQKFQCLHTTMRQHPDIVTKIVLACCILHNLHRMRYRRDALLVDQEDADHNLIPGGWRQHGNMQDVPQPPGPRNTGSRKAKEQREYLANYFLNRGAVPWQEDMV